jgi:hypothetical protein
LIIIRQMRLISLFSLPLSFLEAYNSRWFRAAESLSRVRRRYRYRCYRTVDDAARFHCFIISKMNFTNFIPPSCGLLNDSAIAMLLRWFLRFQILIAFRNWFSLSQWRISLNISLLIFRLDFAHFRPLGRAFDEFIMIDFATIHFFCHFGHASTSTAFHFLIILLLYFDAKLYSSYTIRQFTGQRRSYHILSQFQYSSRMFFVSISYFRLFWVSNSWYA